MGSNPGGSQGNLALFFLSRHPADWNSHLIALVAVREQSVGRRAGRVCPFYLIPLLGGGVAADSAGGGVVGWFSLEEGVGLEGETGGGGGQHGHRGRGRVPGQNPRPLLYH
jgi:hypothetical protein